MFTKTTATASPDFIDDHITLNNEEGSGDNIRFQNCLSEGLFSLFHNLTLSELIFIFPAF